MVETLFQTNRVQVKKEKIAKYSTIKPNPPIQNKFNPSHSHQILTMTVKESPWTLEKQINTQGDAKGWT